MSESDDVEKVLVSESDGVLIIAINRPEVRKAIALGREVAANGPLAVLAAKQTIVESRDWLLDVQFARQKAICGPVRARRTLARVRWCSPRSVRQCGVVDDATKRRG